MFREALEAPVQIRAGGVVRETTKGEALVTTLIDSTVSGDFRASGLLFQTLARMHREPPEPQAAEEATQDLEDFIEREVERRLRSRGLQSSPQDDAS